jgi:hypothetical protein
MEEIETLKLGIRLKESRSAFLDGLEPADDGFAVEDGFLDSVLEVVAVFPDHLFFFGLFGCYL